jgi:hypothetical protein
MRQAMMASTFMRLVEMEIERRRREAQMANGAAGEQVVRDMIPVTEEELVRHLGAILSCVDRDGGAGHAVNSLLDWIKRGGILSEEAKRLKTELTALQGYYDTLRAKLKRERARVRADTNTGTDTKPTGIDPSDRGVQVIYVPDGAKVMVLCPAPKGTDPR